MKSPTRQHCPKCLRAQRACICQCAQPCQSHLSIGILQHPNERLQAKGTARLAALSLNNSHLWLGELLSQSMADIAKGQVVAPVRSQAISLPQWLAQKKTYLLYPETEPSANSAFINHNIIPAGKVLNTQKLSDFQVLVLDGTWRKTHKMLMLNPELQQLPRVTLSPSKTSEYQIRKQKNTNSLATIEAIAQLIEVLEPNSGAAVCLEDNFIQMQSMLLSLRDSQSRGN